MVVSKSKDKKSDYAGEVYFILPREKSNLLQDIIALRMVNELHKTKKTIDAIFLKKEEQYHLLDDYCNKKT